MLDNLLHQRMSVEAVAATDWTEVWVQASPLSAGEVLLSIVLLSATLLLESLSYLLHYLSDNKSNIDTSLVRTNPQLLEQTVKFGYNFESKYVHLPLTTKAGTPRVHYLDVGPKTARNVLVLIHGEPFWSFAWTKVIPGLSADNRVIVPDLVGFGKSDKYVDWRMYDLNLHLETVILLMEHLGIDGSTQKVTMVGHNWGWMVGAGVARLRPNLFSALVILNTNNLPDGEAELDRYSHSSTLPRFLVLNAFFLVFRASMNLLREHFPLGLLVHLLNRRYSKSLVSAMTSPWPTKEHCGGTTAFPLMVPVTASHPEAPQMSLIRQFLSTWTKPTLILYSQSALLPWLKDGNFVVGRRNEFYTKLIPGVVRSVRLSGEVGHLLMWDSPYQVVKELRHFIHY